MEYFKNIDIEMLILELNNLVDETINVYKMGGCWKGKVKAIYISTCFVYNHYLNKDADKFLASRELMKRIGFVKLYEYEDIANYIDELFEI